jgi:hypothetical protein
VSIAATERTSLPWRPDQFSGRLRGETWLAGAGFRRQPASNRELDFRPQPPFIRAQPLRQRFEPGEIAPRLPALPTTQAQTIFKDTYSAAPAVHAGLILAGHRCLGCNLKPASTPAIAMTLRSG